MAKKKTPKKNKVQLDTTINERKKTERRRTKNYGIC